MTLATGGGWPPDFGDWAPADWQTLAAWITAAIAVIAGAIAVQQVREARRLRLEQAQPYVVLFMEPNAASPKFIDLVLRNFGTTAATDVRISVTPALQRTNQGGPPEDVWLPDCIPMMVPGQEWRTFWDFGPDRAQSGLPDKHDVVVTFKDSGGNEPPFTAPAVLDWGAYKNRRWITEYGMHDAAKALREISKTLPKWQEGLNGGLAVFTRSGDEKDERERQRMQAFRDAQQQGAGNDPNDGS